MHAADRLLRASDRRREQTDALGSPAMRSRSAFVVVGSLLLILACAKKGPAIGDHRLAVPAGCKAESV
ncbi:MAG TPA: hypothetical protein VLT33_35850, partial [Labilithrix sp.]|nr:hypothetical protein [Labilithrix sp.]